MTDSRLSERRRSYVRKIWDRPSGSRRRGWGAVRDQIWFPVSSEEFVRLCETRPVRELAPDLCEDSPFWRLYMERWILYLGPVTLRLHVFRAGDDDSAPHDHPWWFVTFPLDNYAEVVENPAEGGRVVRIVRRLRLHRRSALHRHYVLEPRERIRTLVISGRVRRRWGFWPRCDEFVPFTEWTNYQE